MSRLAGPWGAALTGGAEATGLVLGESLPQGGSAGIDQPGLLTTT